MYFGFLRRIFSAIFTKKSIPPATCIAAIAMITDMITEITSNGMAPGFKPSSESATTPIPPIKPIPIPPNLAPR